MGCSTTPSWASAMEIRHFWMSPLFGAIRQEQDVFHANPLARLIKRLHPLWTNMMYREVNIPEAKF